ncbi:hypothetical protein [Kitasatospora purpeofusca]|uniref:hypothetical protein n=1 Tax=Kitasatospora purpeofusca TaxID=67352 RepID=UPI003648CCC9
MVLVAPPKKLRALPGRIKQFLVVPGQSTVTGGIDHETDPETTGFDRIPRPKRSISVRTLTSGRPKVLPLCRLTVTDA